MKIDLISTASKRRPADLFLVGCFQGDQFLKNLTSLEPDFVKSAARAFKNKRFSGKKGEILSSFNPGYNEALEIILVGLGSRDKFTLPLLRETIGKMAQRSLANNAQEVRLFLESFVGGKIRLEEATPAITETALLATYKFDKFQKSQDNGQSKKPLSLEILVARKGGLKNLEKIVRASEITASGTLAARDLINQPGNVINPVKLAEEARRIAHQKKLRCTILGLAELRRMKMGGILAVNQGSKTPPALVILEYGNSYKSRGTICLLGKGVTFDTGGISIKPAADMEKMKYDKAGACTVIATLATVADLKLPLHVVGITPAVENMPSENPQRPGDIIRMYSGKTVEVINTDAEGRLILADALTYAARFKPKAIIDLATLTGMCAYTFADKAIGLMGNDRRLLERIKEAGEGAGERCWELPLWDEYGEMIKGHHSDLLNVGGRYAGTITAGMFLKEFVPEKTPWAHLDIAGTAWCDTPRPDCPKGATGVGVRLLIQLLKNWR